DVALDPGVEGDHLEARGGRSGVAAREAPVALAPPVRLVDAHFAHEIATDQPGEGPRLLHEAGGIALHPGDDAVLGAVIAQVARERPRVDALDAHDVVLPHVRLQRYPPAPVRGIRAGFLDDEAVDPRTPRLHVLWIDAVVADQRVGHAHELAAIGRIGEDLLIARHGSVEDDFAMSFARGPAGAPREDAAVGEREERRRHAVTTLPPTTVRATAPVPVQPANGVLRARERKRDGSTVHARSRSSTVMSAGAPGARLPPGRFSSRAGPGDRRDTSVGRSITPVRTRRSRSTGTAVSSPTTPLAHSLNSPSFSQSACGAWSVAIQS